MNNAARERFQDLGAAGLRVPLTGDDKAAAAPVSEQETQAKCTV